MKTSLQRALPDLPLLIFVLLALQLAWTWIAVRFLHYHSQYQALPADSYSIELITAEDYAKLKDPTLETVTLSNGTSIRDRQPSWYDVVLPNYKPVGDHYVLVTTLGTAHYYHRWITNALPFMMLTALGLLVTIWDRRRQSAESNPPASTATITNEPT